MIGTNGKRQSGKSVLAVQFDYILYIYIYIEREREREDVWTTESLIILSDDFNQFLYFLKRSFLWNTGLCICSTFHTYQTPNICVTFSKFLSTVRIWGHERRQKIYDGTQHGKRGFRGTLTNVKLDGISVLNANWTILKKINALFFVYICLGK